MVVPENYCCPFFLNKIRGNSVCRGAPTISHLFFANDSIFFMEATNTNARPLREILEEYQRLSKQMINFAKSEIVLSNNVIFEERMDIAGIFGVQQVQSHTKYFGIHWFLARINQNCLSSLLSVLGKGCWVGRRNYYLPGAKKLL